MSAIKMKIKKGDTVQILSGKDRGKQGRVLEALPRDGKVIVENLNLIKRHTKPRPMRDPSRMGQTQMLPGGVIERPAPIHLSNVMPLDPKDKKPTRVRIVVEDGKRVRVAARSGERMS